MEIRYDIVQRTAEWHQIKWGKIGGTLSDGLFKNTDTLLIKLLAEHCEEFEMDEDGYYSADMMRGIELEPQAKAQLEIYTGLTFLDAGWIQSSENPLLGISPDGITKDETVMCEIKCPARVKHTRTILEDRIPDDHLEQLIHAFTVNPKLEKLYFCSFRPESIKPLFVKELNRMSLVDLGWTKTIEIEQRGVKGQLIKPKIKKVADIRSVREWVEIAKTEALRLELLIKEKIEELKF
jgi:hypothetical protein